MVGSRQEMFTGGHDHDNRVTNASVRADSAPRLSDDTTWGRAIQRTRRWLLAHQHGAGYWCGELEGDTILESEFILLLAWLGRLDTAIARQASRYIVTQQLPNGGWALYPGGDVDVSVSVKAYFALKLTGHDPDADHMRRARAAILAYGGADRVNSFTRFYLALLGQISYDDCPAVPPEAVLLPRWFPINIYRVSAWSRTILVPLSIIWAYRPVRLVGEKLGIGELFLRPPAEWPSPMCPGLNVQHRWLSWHGFFRFVDSALKWLNRCRLVPLRRRALGVAERWMIYRFTDSDGLGAIFPPIVWSVIALKCRGFTDDSPEVRESLEHLYSLIISADTIDSRSSDRGVGCVQKEAGAVRLDAVRVPQPEDEKLAGTIRLQPCKSPVWDTAISLRALAACGGSPQEPELRRGVEWLLKKEVAARGDWSETVRAEAGGWFFEHRNAFYPDVDDTAMVLMALREQFADSPSTALTADDSMIATLKATDVQEARAHVALVDCVAAASRRGRRWILALQNRDGGWGAFDKDNDLSILCHVPFADHNAMIDPSTPDLTGRVLEALGSWDMRLGQSAVDRGVDYLRRTQQPDGSWYGRWGVNYIYGTWQVLAGLAAVRLPTSDEMITSGASWLLSRQQSCGGWGESPDSYADPALRGRGPVTASQTAWALLGLMAAGLHDHSAVRRGVDYLVQSQSDDGTWQEREFTGTGFPQVFYLRYHLYPVYFPLLALSRWASLSAS